MSSKKSFNKKVTRKSFYATIMTTVLEAKESGLGKLEIMEDLSHIQDHLEFIYE